MSQKFNFFAALKPLGVSATWATCALKMVLVSFAIASVSFASATANADLFFDFTENLGTGQVDVEVSGSLDLDALAGNPSMGANNFLFIDPTAGLVSVGASSPFDLYSSGTSFTSFGAGGQNLFGSNGTGDRVGLFSGQQIGLPMGYTSNTLLMGTSSFTGTFSSLGLTPGSYLTSLDSGVATDSVVVNVGPIAAIPEPSSVILLAAMAGGLVTRRRRKVLG